MPFPLYYNSIIIETAILTLYNLFNNLGESDDLKNNEDHANEYLHSYAQ